VKRNGAVGVPANEQIGAPHGLTIYYSCDRDVTSSQYAAITAYYQAAKDATAGRYKVGVYGEFEIVEELHRRGVVDGEWQTYAWSGGKLSTQTDLYQYRNGQRLAGAAVDFDHIIHASELGAWWPDGHTPAGGGQPIGGLVSTEYDQLKAQISALHDQLDAKADARADEIERLVRIPINGNDTFPSVYQTVAGLAGQVKALQTAVGQLSGGGAIDMAAIEAAAEAGATAAVAKLTITVKDNA